MMTAVSVVTFFFAAFFVGVAIVSGAVFAAMRLRRQGGLREKDRRRQNEEARVIQEIYNNLTRMESRIEALETILMEDGGKDKI